MWHAERQPDTACTPHPPTAQPDTLQLLLRVEDPVGAVCVLVRVLVCVFRVVGVGVALRVREGE